MEVWVVLRDTWQGDSTVSITVDRVFISMDDAVAYVKRSGSTTYSRLDVEGPYEVEPASSAMPPTKWEHVVNNPNFTITISKAKG